jgi:hypothetical protein
MCAKNICQQSFFILDKVTVNFYSYGMIANHGTGFFKFLLILSCFQAGFFCDATKSGYFVILSFIYSSSGAGLIVVPPGDEVAEGIWRQQAASLQHGSTRVRWAPAILSATG